MNKIKEILICIILIFIIVLLGCPSQPEERKRASHRDPVGQPTKPDSTGGVCRVTGSFLFFHYCEICKKVYIRF
jgi:hypothetical protein